MSATEIRGPWSGIRFGLGLLEIGRSWPVPGRPVPSAPAALEFLERAIDLGVPLLDTAPSYGDSEQKLGRFLSSLSPASRDSLVVATKCGEHWDEKAGQPYVDHSWQAMSASLERSFDRLGRIDILQLHKTDPEVLGGSIWLEIAQRARERGVKWVGASASDLNSAEMCLLDSAWDVIQVPLNRVDRRFAALVAEAGKVGKFVLTNRPLKMGALAGKNLEDSIREITNVQFHGAVLFGTASRSHLEEDLAAFRNALGPRMQ